MRRIVLSDYASEVLAQREAERESEYQTALKVYEQNRLRAQQIYDEEVKTYQNALSARQARIDSLRAKAAEAWQTRQLWTVIRYGLHSIAVAITSRPARPHGPFFPSEPSKRGTDHDDHIREVGREGEYLVSDYLGRQLDDSWCLLEGYKNWKGEIDRILVGTGGILALEIKYVHGDIYCDGDRWWRDKWDKYGNLVERDVPIRDKKGRGPSAQVNDSADMLQSFLQHTWPACRIYRMVVVAYESSRLQVSNLTVDEAVLLRDWDLAASFARSTFRLPQPDIEKVVKRIKQDHQYRESKDRERRQATQARPAPPPLRHFTSGVENQRKTREEES